MAYVRPKLAQALPPELKPELYRDYLEYYRDAYREDPASLNRKIPREAFAGFLDLLGEVIQEESACLASTEGPVRKFLNENPLPPKLQPLLPDDFRVFCLALNALKQWLATEQNSTDRYLFGGTARAFFRAEVKTCLVTGDELGDDFERHHPVRDGRPPIVLSKAGHDQVEQTKAKRKRVSTSGDGVERQILQLRSERNGSWKQLRRGCLDLLGRPYESRTVASNATARAFARKVQNTVGWDFEQILAWLNEVDPPKAAAAAAK